MVTVDPLIKLHPPPGRPDLQEQADSFNVWTVNEGYNLICGRVEPELGGSRRHLGIVGFNYYSGNQWTMTTAGHPQRTLSHKDPKCTPLSELMLGIERRYGGPIVFTETSACGADRAPWLEYVVSESVRAREMGVDLQGVCLYPVIRAPDWADPDLYLDAGFYDVVRPQTAGYSGWRRRRSPRPFARPSR